MAILSIVLIDVRQVQRYLFSANELKQNLGASYIVEQATRTWLHEAIKDLKLRHNWTSPDQDEIDETKSIEDENLDVEVVFSGGGNAALLISPDQASKLIQYF